ncbi:MAG: ABC transporter permease, partial [Proteobacteria bacterium]|nr:ABC transporter permease [Pseudomonadota bacterium]
MNPLAGFRIALDALRANKLRSALTMLGIIIGVGAVIVMVAIGAGSRARVAQQLETLGSNLVMVLPGWANTHGARLGQGSRMNLTQQDAVAIRAEIPGVRLSGVTWWAGGQAVYADRNWTTRIHGVAPDFLAARTWAVAQG